MGKTTGPRLALLILAGCLVAACSTPVEDGAGRDAVRESGEEAVQEERPGGDDVGPETDQAEDPAQAESGPVPEVDERQVATPTEVDLREIEPGAEASGQPVEQPAPGIPRPLRKLEREAQVDLAQRLDLDVSEVEVVASEAVEWPDASLGCPRPDEMYAQVVTPGYRIVLRAGGEEYRYHTRGFEQFVLCERPSPDR